MLRPLARILATTVKAIIICHAQKAAPTVATVLEIAALAGPLINTHSNNNNNGGSGSSASDDSLSDSFSTSAAAARAKSSRRSRAAGIAPLQLLLSCSLKLARGWAPAVVVAQGTIVDGEAGPGTVGGLSTAALVRQARENPDVKALVLRVNSPGGSALGSELVRRELALTVRQGCDAFVTRFAPLSWQMDRSELVLKGARGAAWRFEEGDNATTWQRVPEGPEPMLLMKR